MRPLIFAIFLAGSLSVGQTTVAQDLLSPNAFENLVKSKILDQTPDLKVRRIGPFHLEVTAGDGQSAQIFLDNMYKKYDASPEMREELISNHIAVLLETFGNQEQAFDVAQIYPVLRHKSYLRLDTIKFAHAPYNSELVILFAIDSPKSMKFLNETDLEKSGLTLSSLQEAAVKILELKLRSVKLQVGNAVFFLTGGDGYVTSLLLLKDLWNDDKFPVNGKLVAAVPTRDVLIVTGSEDKQGLTTMNGVISDVMETDGYGITEIPFVYEEGQFVRFVTGP